MRVSVSVHANLCLRLMSMSMLISMSMSMYMYMYVYMYMYMYMYIVGTISTLNHHNKDQEALQQSIKLINASRKSGNTDFKEDVRSFLEKRAPNFAPISSNNLVIEKNKKMRFL